MSQAVLENKTKQKVKKPPKYCVVLYNDNITTFDFVIKVLTKIFNKTYDEADALAQLIHENDKAVVGSNYDLDLAQTKVKKTTLLAQSEKFPLKAEVQVQEGDT